MMKMQPSATNEGPPQHLQPGALNTISRRVPPTLRQIHRIQAVATQAQPMIVIKRDEYQDTPTDIGQTRCRQKRPEPLSVRSEIGDEPAHDHPGQIRLNQNDHILKRNGYRSKTNVG